jgi:FMN phosphatase YigB (HAD superfamily)/sugar phosphate isomerase/epimerase
MNHHIDAILFDVGGTLRRCIVYDEGDRVAHVQKLLDLLGMDMPVQEFMQLLVVRARMYRKWAKENLSELDEVRLWTEWMMPDFPADKIAPIAVELNLAWRDVRGVYEMIPGSHQSIQGLFRGGYRLGLVSNTTSSVDVPRMLEKERLSGFFDTVILSCVVGKRKPGAEILQIAANRMGIKPENCAYIGNLPERDAASARNAGFKMAVILRDPEKPFRKAAAPENEPDFYIDDLAELLKIFPSRSRKVVPVGPRYDLSFSTMWGMKKFDDLNDFLACIPRFGMTAVELNHQVQSGVLERMQLAGYQVSSIHEPCPAEVPADEMKKRDLLISAPDAGRRRQGVDSIKRSIDLAHTLGAHTVVVHPGQIQVDGGLEVEMRALIRSGQGGSQRFFELRDQVVALRSQLVGPYLEAVSQSLRELLQYVSGFNVRLGIENRYHIFDIPWLDEMEDILSLAGGDRLGFLYDVGHAQSLDRLGFIPHEEWLKRFASRIIGVHLHDVVGVEDHKAPGLGEMDFHRIASYLPKDAYRVLEIHGSNTPEQVTAGLKILADTGCIKVIQ